MSLRRVGGKSDGGIDLLGWWWWLPAPGSRACLSTTPRRRPRVLAQRKVEKKEMSPQVRSRDGGCFASVPRVITTGLAADVTFGCQVSCRRFAPFGVLEQGQRKCLEKQVQVRGENGRL